MHAEVAYLFRHALLRDAAYQLQTPGNRAQLHELALYLIENTLGGRAPAAPPILDDQTAAMVPHPTDSISRELALQARQALVEGGPREAELAEVQRLYLRRSAEHSERSYDFPAALGSWLEYAGLLGGVEQAEAKRRASGVAFQVGRLNVAEPLLLEALDVFTRAGTARLIGQTMSNLASTYRRTGRVAAAEDAYQNSRPYFLAARDTRGQAFALGNLGTLYREMGRLGEAQELSQQAVELLENLGDRRTINKAKTNLAIVYRLIGKTEEAEGALKALLLDCRAIGDQPGENFVLGELAIIRELAGDLNAAESLYELALTGHRKLGDRHFEAMVMGNLANVQRELGRLANAEASYQRSLEIFREIGDRRGEGVQMGNMAGYLRHVGRIQDAEAAFRMALALHAECKNHHFEGYHRCDFAILLIASSCFKEARTMWLQGDEILRKLGAEAARSRKAATMRQACAGAGIQPFDVPEGDHLRTSTDG